jgi:hypothetical protein
VDIDPNMLSNSTLRCTVCFECIITSYQTIFQQDVTSFVPTVSLASIAMAGYDSTNKLKVSSTILPIFTNDWNRQQKQVLSQIFKVLHGVLVSTSDERAFDSFKLSSEDALTELALNDKSPLMSCIFALGYGELMEDALPPPNNLSRVWSKYASRVNVPFCVMYCTLLVSTFAPSLKT